MSDVENLGPLPAEADSILVGKPLVATGFPSPATDHVERKISLDEHLGIRAPHVYVVRVKGEGMIGAGIMDGGLLIVSRGQTAKHGDIVIAVIDGDTLVRRLHRRREQTILVAENPAFPPRYLMEGESFLIWGVVTHSLAYHQAGTKK